ncbi:DUF4087 domain-containing protein [Pseudomonas sp. BC42]|uniref:DUF4087 domain-containing protein n=1 Tax=Pseudomonas sp. BC42 TaxID=2933816 RepID=UPI001F3F710D|nr:DUF4087 domain-containing protein [Pseudomonas sp. BC42]ULT71916.1 DUF4087 domain-containing protein [Pseudomonas sp. BC42]
MLQRVMLCTLLTVIALPAFAAPAKVERRCGWFENPTPANATLTDRDGVWEIASQGGYQAEGDWPTFNDQQWVRTNNHYGYGCACVSASADPRTHRLDQLHKAQARPLSACRNDPRLYEPLREEDGIPVLPEDSPRFNGPGFSLQYPKGWKLSQTQNCLTLDHPNKRPNEEYTLHLCLRQGSLEQAAEELFFYQENGVWMRSAGRDAPSPVQDISGPGWKGLRAYQTCGISDEETGFHAYGGTCLMALLDSSRRQVVADSVGFFQDFATLDAILHSIRFDPVPAAQQNPH